jgi:hypothetical protein
MRSINSWVYDGEFGMEDNLQRNNGLWTETNYETYLDQLNSVPPFTMNRNYFIVGEPYYGYLHACFFTFKERYFGKFVDVRFFDAYSALKEILHQFSFEHIEIIFFNEHDDCNLIVKLDKNKIFKAIITAKDLMIFPSNNIKHICFDISNAFVSCYKMGGGNIIPFVVESDGVDKLQIFVEKDSFYIVIKLEDDVYYSTTELNEL